MSYTLEWDGIVHNEKTKKGYEIMRLSKNGNVRIVYRQFMVQGKYAVERKLKNEHGVEWWDGYGMYSDDFLGRVEEQCKYMLDECLEV